MRIDVLIPALDEAASIGRVVRAVPRPPVRTVFVVDNGSADGTAEAAADAGATVVLERRRGYGSACLAGIRALPSDTELAVFMDGDGSDDAAQIDRLIEPILQGNADLVVGSRAAAARAGALTRPQRIGNVVASSWLRLRFGMPATDLGPFRAIRRRALDDLAMSDPDYGWTVEMQIKAARRGLRYVEVPVASRPRQGGRSKVSGTLRGTLGATVKILGLLAWHDVVRPRLA